MLRIERYLFRTVAAAFLGSLATLTAIIWTTQALRQLDLMTSKGQTILVFLSITGLGLPFLSTTIAPVALFASVLYSLNKLNGDSELVVMTAAGVSPWRILKPYLALFSLVFVAAMAMYIEVMPLSFDAITTLTSHMHGDFIANFARPGPFIELEAGFTFHYRERAPDGSLRGIFIQDSRNPEDAATYIAEKGDIIEKDGKTFLLLVKGSTQHPRGAGDSSIITFDDYAIDLAQFVHVAQNIAKPREIGTVALLKLDPKSLPPAQVGPVRAEIYDRLTSPFYAFSSGLIGFAALREARTTRQGRGLAIGVAILIFVAVKALSMVDALMLRGKPGLAPPLWAPIFAWALPIGSTLICLDLVFNGPLTRAFGPLWRRRRARAAS